MNRNLRLPLFVSSALALVACAEGISRASSTDALDAAFTSTPVGFEFAASSFADSNPAGKPFGPGDQGGPRGPNGLGGGHDFMGGGFGIDFLGGLAAGGRPFDHGGSNSAPTASCTFASGVVTCGPTTQNGVTVTRTIVYRTAAGTAQAAQDSTTNSITTHVVVSGTTTRRDNATTVVSSTSDRVVTGVASTSTQRTVNGSSKGSESSTGTDSAGAYTALRSIGDTATGVIIPVVSGKPSYPTAGRVIRSMSATVTHTGKSPVTSTRSEVVTYDGTATAKLVITRDGTVKNCTIALPRGRPVCS